MESNDTSKQCALCEKVVDSFACSHIVARGFYECLPDKTKMIVLSSDGEQRRRPNAHYIENKICHDCEKVIFKELDEYAISIYGQKVGGENYPKGAIGNNSICIFENVDRRKLRAFWASLLWRFSIADIWELKDVSIGKIYEERIRKDLLAGGEFEYIDALAMFLTGPNAEMYSTPRRFRMTYCGSEPINAYDIRIPALGAYVSLDKRPHPVLEHSKWIVEGRRLSPSLCKDAEGARFAVTNRDVMVDDVERFVEMYQVYKERREEWLAAKKSSARK